MSQPRAQKSALVVEDQPWVARAIRRALRQAGYRVEVAFDCARARASPGLFDVGIFDLELPDGCGLTLARELLAACAVARVVFFTGCNENSLLEVVSELAPVIRKRDGLTALLRVVAIDR